MLPFWLTSFFEGKKDTVRKLCEAICKELPEEVVAASVVEGKVLTREQLRKLSDELIPAIRKYLAWRQLESQEMLLEANLLQLLLNRNALSLFPKIMKESHKRVSRKPVKEAECYHHIHQLDKLWLSYELRQGMHPEKSIFEAPMKAYERAVSFEVLNYLVAGQTATDLLGYEIDFPTGEYIAELLEPLPKEELLKEPLLYVLREQYRGLRGDKIDLSLTWGTFTQIATKLPSDQGINVYRTFSNLFKKVLGNLVAAREEQLDFFKLAYDTNIWAEEHLRNLPEFLDIKYIRSLMINVLRIAELSDGKDKEGWIEKAKERVVEVGKSLAKDQQRDFMAIYMAEIQFLEGKYEQILKPIKAVKLESTAAMIDHQLLILQVYFERHDFSTLEKNVESLKKRIKYNKEKFTKRMFDHFYKSVTHFSKLVSLTKEEEIRKSPTRKVALQKLADQIGNETYFKLKFWLLKKIKERI